MNISEHFIKRPIFASVISIFIFLIGLAAMKMLPIEQYPEITPPLIQVTATYNGANAETMASDVAAPLEQQINGCEDMIYMYSQNSSNGDMTLSVYFAIGSDPNMAQVNVQNLVSQALPQLPEEVQRTGVTVQQQAPNILLIAALQSPSGRYDDIFTSNYASINLVPELQLLPGVSNVNIIGARNYSMRIWLRPDLMAQLGITTSDVVQAIQNQNTDYGIGQLGQAPNAHPVTLTIPLSAKGRLNTPEEFENIVLRATNDGAMVLLKDVAEVSLGAQDYSVSGQMDGKLTTLIAIYQEYGANALDVAQSVKSTMDRLSRTFPEGLVYTIPYDTTLYIKASIKDVIHTLLEATLLVVLVVLVFLQKLRMTLIPVIALVVSIVGTFAGMYLLGFSINTLTLFGMVLAIGIVVDDAIVVVENVERNMRELKLHPMDAAKKAMREVSGPIVAIVLVLCAVFIPIAFLGGIAGQLYKQFAITICISVIFSGIVALTLSPALAARLLKEHTKEIAPARWFNKGFGHITTGYMKGAQWMIGQRVLGCILFLCLIVSLLYFFKVTPTGLVPMEDQGFLITFNKMPDGASLSRTQEVDMQFEKLAMQHPGVEHVVSLTGYNLMQSLNQTTIGTNFVVLKDWSQRNTPELQAAAIGKDLNKKSYMIQNAQVMTFSPPAIQGLGTVGGFEFWIENRGEGSFETLVAAVDDVIAATKKRPELAGVMSTFELNNMLLYVDIDRYQAKILGVPLGEVFQTLQALLGSVYVNNFNKAGRVFQVIVQADPKFRDRIENLADFYVRSDQNEMVPLNSLLSVSYKSGPYIINRFNSFYAVKLLGGPAPGYSSGQAMEAMVQVAEKTLPPDMVYAWSGEAYQEMEAGSAGTMMLIASLVMVFLILAALYEKWSLPLAILLAVPFGILGAFLAIHIAKMSNDIYFQIGLVTLVALAAKNAILIVEFAVMKHKEGMRIREAALEAAKLRFRAIIMTSLTFIFGVIPLVISSGAGAASRHSVGVGVLGGMIMASTLALFFVPLFFRLIMGRFGRKERLENSPHDEPKPPLIEDNEA
ncbi:MAG: multidrug efflux RND transporter permease subunit [Parachlamydiales bacterium]|nr:multidrug efflux RND transporter permease subunit [Parachlamydiales bacterium]